MACSALLLFHGTPSWSRNVKSFSRLFWNLRLIALGDLGCVASLGQSAEEAIDRALVPAEVLAAEPVLVHRPYDRPEKFAEPGGHGLQLLVVGRLEEVVVQVSDQVDEALLLRARQGVVGGEKV